MSKQYDSEGFMSSPLEGAGARPKDSYHHDSEDNEVQFRAADEEYQRLKADFARIARDKRLHSHSRSDSSRSSSPLGRQPQKRATNLPKFSIATFYASDVELWFNQIETQFALHQIEDDDERYSLTCAALSGEIASDVRDVLLQPFRSNKYDSLKAILIERRGLTTPERVNKVISGEKIGSDIPSRFLRRLQKTAGFGTKAVVGKAVIRQAFIRQMPASIRAHLATQPDSASLVSLAILADRALAAEQDVEESKPGVAEIKVDETSKLVGLLEDLSKRIKKLETVTTSEIKRNKGRGRANNYAHAPAFVPNVQASGSLVINIANIETFNIMLDLMFRRRMYRPMSLLIGLIQIIVLMHHKMFSLSHRRRKIMSHNQSTQPLHRFAITTTSMVKRRACAVNPVHTMFH